MENPEGSPLPLPPNCFPVPPPPVASQTWALTPVSFPPPLMFPNAWTPSIGNEDIGMLHYPVSQANGTVPPTTMAFNVMPPPAVITNVPPPTVMTNVQPPSTIPTSVPLSNVPCPIIPSSTPFPFTMYPVPPEPVLPSFPGMSSQLASYPVGDSVVAMNANDFSSQTSMPITSISSDTPSLDSNQKANEQLSSDPRLKTKRRGSSHEKSEVKSSQLPSDKRNFQNKGHTKTKDKDNRSDSKNSKSRLNSRHCSPSANFKFSYDLKQDRRKTGCREAHSGSSTHTEKMKSNSDSRKSCRSRSSSRVSSEDKRKQWRSEKSESSLYQSPNEKRKRHFERSESSSHRSPKDKIKQRHSERSQSSSYRSPKVKRKQNHSEKSDSSSHKSPKDKRKRRLSEKSGKRPCHTRSSTSKSCDRNIDFGSPISGKGHSVKLEKSFCHHSKSPERVDSGSYINGKEHSLKSEQSLSSHHSKSSLSTSIDIVNSGACISVKEHSEKSESRLSPCHSKCSLSTSAEKVDSSSYINGKGHSEKSKKSSCHSKSLSLTPEKKKVVSSSFMSHKGQSNFRKPSVDKNTKESHRKSRERLSSCRSGSRHPEERFPRTPKKIRSIKDSKKVKRLSGSPLKKSSDSREMKDSKNIGSRRLNHSVDPSNEKDNDIIRRNQLSRSSRSRTITPSAGRRGSSATRERSHSIRPSENERKGSVKPQPSSFSRFRGKKSPILPDRGSHSRLSKVPRRSRSRERYEDQPSLSTEASKWITSTPAELYYSQIQEGSKEVVGTDALKDLHQRFEHELVKRAERERACKPKYVPPVRKTKLRKHKPPAIHSGSESTSTSEESSSDEDDTSLEELEKKRQHPDRLHPELWFNDPKEMNDGPLCRCSAKARKSGIRHGIYVGEGHLPPCKPHSNNANSLYHYKIAMTPVTNFLTESPTIIVHDGEKYIFEGFSMFSHKKLPKLPNCKVIRFNYEYTIMYIAEEMPQNFTVAGLDLFSKFLLGEVLELVDLDWKAHNDAEGCPQFHFMPRFAKNVKGDGKELLSLNAVLEYLLKSNKILVDEKRLPEVLEYSNKKWQEMANGVKGMLVTCPGMKPSSIRVDQLDREHIDSNQKTLFPVIVHFGVRPPQLSYAGNPLYQKAWRDYVKYRHLLANKPKVLYSDRHKLTQKELKLQEMRMENDLKRDVTVVISSKDFFRTGIKSDVVQHAMLLPVLVCHLRFHNSLRNLEEEVGYTFKDRFLLQLAMTHPSYRENFGTNPDHARNSLTNCGLRQPQYGDRRIQYMNTRKRGINTLINIMSQFGNQQESNSSINHNERLEFLGDAVVEFLSSVHLFHMFPDLEEGGLATYRAAIVQNQHLAVLAKKLHLEKFMLYAHGSDLCHDLELKHAMANCFEALMGALFLDDGIEVADKVLSVTLFPEPELQEVWRNFPLHPLQEQEPGGDRRWIETVPLLQKCHEFEEQIGIEFTHIRLLARALTHRSLGYNNLTLGSNQRLEFLGDTVLQLVASEYLYKFFPQHHEGHLSLLRSSLVNNRTQAVVCGDLGMVQYAIYPYAKVDLRPKDKADFMEAFLGALYVDKDLGYCRKFCEVCFFPRLEDFIMNQEWNDPKSKLQQCCLTLRSMDGGEPDIPKYKVIQCKGPTNTRVYEVAVYFKGSRLAVGEGHSIQQAEMDAADNALKKSKDLFPQLKHQEKAIERSLKKGTSRRSGRKL